MSRVGLRRHATEGDVLHTPVLPCFGGAVGAGEAELFLSMLTVPRLSVPLVLAFVADNRVGMLFVPARHAAKPRLVRYGAHS